MLSDDLSSEVGRTSAFWQEYRQRLAHLQSHWRGREQDYLDLVKGVVATNIEAYRGFLLKATGLDIKTGQQAAPAPQSQYTPWQTNFLVNAERAALDWITIAKTMVRATQVAKDNGKDPTLVGYDMFFWALENVPAAGTVFLMQDVKAIPELEGEQEGAALLLSGWADAHLSLQGNRAARLLQALQSEG